MSEYKKYLHVERLGSEECEGLLDNDAVYVTAKVDGSNGCVYWSEKAGGVMVGSIMVGIITSWNGSREKWPSFQSS